MSSGDTYDPIEDQRDRFPLVEHDDGTKNGNFKMSFSYIHVISDFKLKWIFHGTMFNAFLKKSLSLFLCAWSPPDSSVHWILQARTLEWVAISFRGFSVPSNQIQVSYIAGKFFTIWATREDPQNVITTISTCHTIVLWYPSLKLCFLFNISEATFLYMSFYHTFPAHLSIG